MLNNKRIVAVIPARGGSKGVPGKNIKLLNEKPLIAYSIEAAKGSSYIDRLIVSTDDSEIKDIAVKYGAEVPFLRPKELSEDTTPTLPVLQHVVNYLEKEGDTVDVVITLQPTSPFRTSNHIDEALEKLLQSPSESVVSLSEVDYHPYWMKKVSNGTIHSYIESEKEYLRRQDLPKVYKMNGAIFITPRNVLMEERLI
ncbi:acylneuraminate cytidylyltransferase family protein, partial [Priestia megaterium]|uniref:acylneuraminate cytidylyltransferase family protein n=1 Tax=Priestia megaterium TaxID=1404 RepID=UPI002FFE5C6D